MCHLKSALHVLKTSFSGPCILPSRPWSHTTHHLTKPTDSCLPWHVTFLVLKARTCLWKKREALRYRLRSYVYLSDGGKKVGRNVLQVGNFILALWISITRVNDYMHHSEDVFLRVQFIYSVVKIQNFHTLGLKYFKTIQGLKFLKTFTSSKSILNRLVWLVSAGFVLPQLWLIVQEVLRLETSEIWTAAPLFQFVLQQSKSIICSLRH